MTTASNATLGRLVARLESYKTKPTEVKSYLTSTIVDADSQDVIDISHEIASLKSHPWISRVSFTDDTGIDMTAHPGKFSRGSLTIKIDKVELENVIIALSKSYLSRVLRMENIDEIRNVLVPCEGVIVAAQSLEIAGSITNRELTLSSKNPRKYVKSFKGGNELPQSISPWIAVGECKFDNDYGREWLSTACFKLAISCFAEVDLENKSGTVNFGGSFIRGVSIVAKPSPLTITYNSIRSVAEFIYDGHDTETKFALINSELHRSWPGEQEIFHAAADVLPSVLETSRISYQVHIKSGGRETLKALSELRKSVAEDTSKLVSYGRDLISGLWKDATVGILAIVTRAATSYNNPGSSKVLAVRGIELDPGRAVVLGAAAYLTIVVIFNAYSLWSYLSSFNMLQDAWRRRISTYFEEGEYEELVLSIINRSKINLFVQSFMLLCVYVSVICLFVFVF